MCPCSSDVMKPVIGKCFTVFWLLILCVSVWTAQGVGFYSLSWAVVLPMLLWPWMTTFTPLIFWSILLLTLFPWWWSWQSMGSAWYWPRAIVLALAVCCSVDWSFLGRWNRLLLHFRKLSQLWWSWKEPLFFCMALMASVAVSPDLSWHQCLPLLSNTLSWGFALPTILTCITVFLLHNFFTSKY